MPQTLKDAGLKVTRACPATVTGVTSSPIDLQNSSRGDFSARVELLLTAPALNTGQLPDLTTLTYDLQTSNASNMASPTTLVAGAIVQTGNTGHAGTTYRFKPPTNVLRYIGFKMTGANNGNTAFGNCAAANATLEPCF